MENTIFPAGTYYIGDLSYVITEGDKWLKVNEMCDYFQKPHVFELYGNKAMCCRTAWGDGVYDDVANKYRFGVDSGSIGICDVKSIQDPYILSDSLLKHSAVIKFNKAFVVKMYDGIFRFGDEIVISTK